MTRAASIVTVESCIDATTLTHYVIVRRDLPIGMIGANIVHAAGESSPGNLPEGTRAVVLQVPDQQPLIALAEHLRRARVPHRLVVETEGDYSGQAMALGVTPGEKEVLREYFSCLPLLK